MMYVHGSMNDAAALTSPHIILWAKNVDIVSWAKNVGCSSGV
jgi:hypothetical protein